MQDPEETIPELDDFLMEQDEEILTQNTDPVVSEIWNSIRMDKHSDKILLMGTEELQGLEVRDAQTKMQNPRTNFAQLSSISGETPREERQRKKAEAMEKLEKEREKKQEEEAKR